MITSYRLVMIIDDDDICSIMAQHLINKTSRSTRSIIMPSAFSALAYLNERNEESIDWPDLILLDINMPVIDGFEFLEKFLMYSECMTAKTEIILLSSAPQNDQAKQYVVKGIVKKYIQKPLKENHLLLQS